MAFARLHAEGVRVDGGLLWVRFLPDASVGAARVGFAVPRQVGSAVIRNKIRRRLRAAVRSIDRESRDGLPIGLYLIGTQRSRRQYSYADLRVSLLSCLSKLDRPAS